MSVCANFFCSLFLSFCIFRRRFHIRFVTIYGIDLVLFYHSSQFEMAFKTMKRSWLLASFRNIFFFICFVCFCIGLKLCIIIKMENLIEYFETETAKHEKGIFITSLLKCMSNSIRMHSSQFILSTHAIQWDIIPCALFLTVLYSDVNL